MLYIYLHIYNLLNYIYKRVDANIIMRHNHHEYYTDKLITWLKTCTVTNIFVPAEDFFPYPTSSPVLHR
jgi:hypothetical protein